MWDSESWLQLQLLTLHKNGLHGLIYYYFLSQDHRKIKFLFNCLLYIFYINYLFFFFFEKNINYLLRINFVKSYTLTKKKKEKQKFFKGRVHPITYSYCTNSHCLGNRSGRVLIKLDTRTDSVRFQSIALSKVIGPTRVESVPFFCFYIYIFWVLIALFLKFNYIYMVLKNNTPTVL